MVLITHGHSQAIFHSQIYFIMQVLCYLAVATAIWQPWLVLMLSAAGLVAPLDV
jgi:hypothetical protein